MDATGISPQLAKAIDATSPDLLKIYNNLPDVSPLADSEPEAAFMLHSLLASLDPTVASRWHWKDTRKVLRSLQIIKQSGRLSSDIIYEQSESVPEPRYIVQNMFHFHFLTLLKVSSIVPVALCQS